MHYIFSLLIILPLGIVASPLADITDNPKYYAADQVNAPAIPIFNTDQINDEGAESDVYPEVAFGDTGAKLAGQDDISLSPQPFELAKQVEKTSANPCPGQTTVCAKKTQYFPLFKCYPCEEYDSAADLERKKCSRENIFCCQTFDGDETGDVCGYALQGTNLS